MRNYVIYSYRKRRHLGWWTSQDSPLPTSTAKCLEWLGVWVCLLYLGNTKNILKNTLDFFLTGIKQNLFREEFTGSLIFRHANVPFLIDILNEMIVVIQCFRILAPWHFPIEKGQNHPWPAGRSWATRKVGDIYMEWTINDGPGVKYYTPGN